MNRRMLPMAVLTVGLLVYSTAFAYVEAPEGGEPLGISVAINFGADEPDNIRSDVTGPAGVLRTPNWNNLDGPTGLMENLTADDAGGAVPSTTTVEWTSNNTWSSTGLGEENNTAPDGNDRNLMSGYLDTTDISVTEVTVSGLDSGFVDGYDVYAYIKGGVNGRGGNYTIGTETQMHVDMAAFSGDYVFGDEGDYIIFKNVTGSSFTITATPTTPALFRAPLNALEVVCLFCGTAVRGDVNGDGVADNLDFDIIRMNFFDSAVTKEDGDLNRDGIVNWSDFREWKNAVAAPGSSSAVPEPAGLVSLFLAAGGWWGLSCRCTRGRASKPRRDRLDQKFG
jgi:hypothetical protein